jgi:hypothetical protein
MATIHDDVRADALERRALWIVAFAIVAFVFGTYRFGLGLGDASVWKVALFVANQAALVGSVGAAALTFLPPAAVPRRWIRVQIPGLLALAFALFWAGLVLTAVLVSAAAIEEIGESEF